MKAQKSTGTFLALAGGVLAVVALILYRNVMYTYQPVYYLLIGAIAAAVLCFLTAGAAPKIAGLFPIIGAALMASAAVWGASLMVNQIGYVVAGLDGIDTIMSFIIFAVLAVAGMIMFILASFLPVALVPENA